MEHICLLYFFCVCLSGLDWIQKDQGDKVFCVLPNDIVCSTYTVCMLSLISFQSSGVIFLNYFCRFQADLLKLEGEYEQRDPSRHVDYEILHPKFIPNAISI